LDERIVNFCINRPEPVVVRINASPSRSLVVNHPENVEHPVLVEHLLPPEVVVNRPRHPLSQRHKPKNIHADQFECIGIPNDY
jgi:hypothetical protein